MDMQIVSLACAMSEQRVGQNFGVAIINLAKKQMEQQSEDLQELFGSMEQSVNPHIGSSIDISI